jgi:iron complex outermembrane receptor protein
MTVHSRKGAMIYGAAAAALSMFLAPTAVCAQDAVYSFNIPAQSLGSALRAYAGVTHQQVVIDNALVGAKRSPALVGSYSADEALRRLVAGSGLTSNRTPAGVIYLGNGSRAVEPRSPQAMAAPDEDAAMVDEVIVTASKREERLKDVPSSVTALGGASLLRQNAVKFEDYAARVPGLTVQNVSIAGGLNQITLRGITTGFGGTPTVGLYVDDTPFGASAGVGSSSSAPDLDPADLERVEVLRGPQGTLYGAGAMGGLIKFVTRDPSTAGFSGRLQADALTTDGGGDGWALRGSANLPLSENLAMRISGYTREDPGFVDDPVHGETDVNANRFSGARMSLLWTPSDATKVRLSALIQHQENDGSATVDIDSVTFKPLLPDLQQSHAPGTDTLDTTMKLYGLRVTHDFGWAELLSVSSWSENTLDTRVDFSPSFGGLLFALFGAENAGATIHTVNKLTKFTQEFRLTSPSANRLFWQAGLLYTDEKVDAIQSIDPVDATTGAHLVLPTVYEGGVDFTFREAAAFGTLGYKFTDQFDISVGGRVSRNDQHSIETGSGVLAGAGGSAKSHDTSFTFLVTPRYRVNEDLMVYGRIASGYRPGGPNLSVAGADPSVGPDTLVNYEVGVKADLFEKAVSLELSAFLIDWKDIQVLQLTADGLGYQGNAAKARSRGVEASALYRPFRGLQIAGNVTYLDAYLTQALTAPLSLVGRDGEQLPSAPRWAGSLSVDYDFQLGGDWSGFVGASWRYTGDRKGDFRSIFAPSRPRAELEAYDAIDLRAGVKYRQWALSAYAKNIADERGYIAAFPQGNVTSVSLTQPRTFGLTLSTEF